MQQVAEPLLGNVLLFLFSTTQRTTKSTSTYKVDIAILQFTQNEIEDIEVFEKNIILDLINASFNMI